MPAFAPKSTLLDTAERNSRVGDVRGVDPDHTNLQRLGNSPDPTDISGIEVARESDVSVVGQLDHFLLSFKFDQSCDGSKSLFLTEEG